MKEIISAFVKAQKAFAPALKTATNPHYKSRYADLSACIEAVLDALNANSIALIQRTHDSDNGVAVETLFIHESGETLSGGILHVPATKQDAPGYGSALTYARRYSLMAACGIAPEDDDGQMAEKTPARAIPRVAMPKPAEQERPARTLEELSVLVAGMKTIAELQILWNNLSDAEKVAAKEIISIRKKELSQ